MAIEHVGVLWSSGATLELRCVQPGDGTVFDWSDNQWKPMGGAVAPTRALDECPHCGDAQQSLYHLAVDLVVLDMSIAPRTVWFQLIADGEVIEQREASIVLGTLHVYGGERFLQ